MEKQCNDPKLMHCGLEKCVAADGSVEWVAAHSKVRLDPHLPPIAHSHVPNARVAALSHPTAGTLPARGRQVPHLEPAQPGSLFKLELAGIKRVDVGPPVVALEHADVRCGGRGPER